MQLMPATAQRFGVGNPFDAGQNIQGGVKYLAWLLKRFNGDLTLAAAGYNAGEGAVDKYNGVPPYKETQRYVQRVGALAQRSRRPPAAPNYPPPVAFRGPRGPRPPPPATDALSPASPFRYTLSSLPSLPWRPSPPTPPISRPHL